MIEPEIPVNFFYTLRRKVLMTFALPRQKFKNQ